MNMDSTKVKMPRYDFVNKESGEELEKFCTYEEKLLFLKQNPQWQSAFKQMNIIGGVSVSEKGDGGMREIFSKIAENHPNSALASRYGKKSIKQLKATRAYDKHKKRTK